MGYAIIGLLVGVLIIMCLMLWWDVKEYSFKGKRRTIVKSIIFFASIVDLIIPTMIGYSLSINESMNWIKQYEISKTTIENSAKNENLSGFEKVELVKQAVELNQKLASKQYDCKTWYGFGISKEVLNLENISLD